MVVYSGKMCGLVSGKKTSDWEKIPPCHDIQPHSQIAIAGQ